MKGVVIAGAGSGVGKTSITTGLISRLSKDMKVQAFKAGPDFIDPMYHTAASGRHSRNLDSFMMGDATIKNLVGTVSADADICIVEGVRGLFEGLAGDSDIGSTAYLAKLLGFPVILVVDARSLNRSAAAIINGFKAFDPDVNIAGVIFNKVSGRQHTDKLKTVMDTYCKGTETVGMISKDESCTLEERYLGLRTISSSMMGNISFLGDMVSSIDTDRLMDIAESNEVHLPDGPLYASRDSGARVAVPMDESFCFYYRENIECLQASGADVVTFRPTEGDPLPDADVYYLGGGYPELHAGAISSNRDFTEGLRNASEEGKVVMGECGGLMAMCRDIVDADSVSHPMAGIFDASAKMTGIRHGPTYVIAEGTSGNPLFPNIGVKAHEYHYSDVFPDGKADYGFKVSRGKGITGGMDGLYKRNSLGSYMHQHALSAEDWAKGIIGAIR